jgi:hypothetical protein
MRGFFPTECLARHLDRTTECLTECLARYLARYHYQAGQGAHEITVVESEISRPPSVIVAAPPPDGNPMPGA